MGEQSPKPTSTPTGAVFLSYAWQDSDAADDRDSGRGSSGFAHHRCPARVPWT